MSIHIHTSACIGYRNNKGEVAEFGSGNIQTFVCEHYEYIPPAIYTQQQVEQMMNELSDGAYSVTWRDMNLDTADSYDRVFEQGVSKAAEHMRQLIPAIIEKCRSAKQ